MAEVSPQETPKGGASSENLTGFAGVINALVHDDARTLNSIKMLKWLTVSVCAVLSTLVVAIIAVVVTLRGVHGHWPHLPFRPGAGGWVGLVLHGAYLTVSGTGLTWLVVKVRSWLKHRRDPGVGE